MYPDDLYLLMPELVLGGAAGIIILLDLVIKKEGNTGAAEPGLVLRLPRHCRWSCG